MNIAVCSIKGLRSTILRDYYVYRWFLYLLRQSSLRSELSACQENRIIYEQLGKITRLQWFLGILILGLSMLYLKTKFFLLLISLAVACLCGFKVLAVKKRYVADLSLHVIERDFPADKLAKTTLYQIGEIFGEKYQVLSLVDAIYHLDKIYRFTLIFSFFLVAYIVNIGNWKIRQASFFSLYFTVVFLVNTPFFYKKFK